MRIFILLLLFLSFKVFANNEDFKKNAYLDLLNSCSDGNLINYKISIPDYLSNQEIYIFVGNNLDEKCLSDKYLDHHINYNYRMELGIPPLMSVGDYNIESLHIRNINFNYLDSNKQYATITSLYNYKCITECLIDKDKIFYKKDKFIYIYGMFNNLYDDANDSGYEGVFLELNKNILLFRFIMKENTFYYLFDTASNSLIDINSGTIEFFENFYLNLGKEEKFKEDEPFWFDVKYSYNGDILELINTKGFNTYCYGFENFKYNKSIYKFMKKNKMQELCVFK